MGHMSFAASRDPAAALKDRLPRWQARRVTQHVEDNLHRSLKVDELAALARKSVSHFSRAFRGSFGKPPHAYILERRIERAKHHLAGGRHSLCDIALACGLADQAHLSRLFRRHEGLPPGAWRRRQLEG